MAKAKAKPPALYQVAGYGSLAKSSVSDMLRYDACTFIGEETDANGDTIALVAYPAGRKPTVERWQSYRWSIVPFDGGATCPDCRSRVFHRNHETGNVHCSGCKQRAASLYRLDNSTILPPQIQESR